MLQLAWLQLVALQFAWLQARDGVVALLACNTTRQRCFVIMAGRANGLCCVVLQRWRAVQSNFLFLKKKFTWKLQQPFLHTREKEKKRARKSFTRKKERERESEKLFYARKEERKESEKFLYARERKRKKE
jgi:hypothetical protein